MENLNVDAYRTALTGCSKRRRL